MSYKLRFIQKFRKDKTAEFMELEKKFAELEKSVPEFPKGTRYIPYKARDPVNTLIWECEFPSLEDIDSALKLLETDIRHKELYDLQSQYFLEASTEIYEILEV